jgi:hypothetical protein
MAVNVSLKMKIGFVVRPHPGPLPQEREKRRPRCLQPHASFHLGGDRQGLNGIGRGKAGAEFPHATVALPLPGERAGVRADVCLNFGTGETPVLL